MTTHLDDDFIVRSGGSLTIATGASLVLEDGITFGGYESFAANGSMPATSSFAAVDTTSGSVTVTLPALADVETGHTMTFWKAVAANSMVIDGNGAEQIEGANNVTRTTRYSIVQIRKTATAWTLLDPLKASLNLAELGSAATARGNLGIQQILHNPVISLAIADAAVWYYVHPTGAPDAVITSIDTRLSGALTTGDATLTAAINGTPVTNGVVTITQSGSAAGDLDSASPSAARTITAGQVLSLTVGGTNDAARTAAVSVRLTY